MEDPGLLDIFYLFTEYALQVYLAKVIMHESSTFPVPFF